jgi:hypothetical protein
VNVSQDVLPAGPQEDSQQSGLRVEFEWIKDRFAHRVLAFVDDSWVPLMQSVEGDDENLWPPSPALQQLSIEPRTNDKRAALAVGMSGRSHYSISVDADQITPSLNYDVACRYTEQPEFIGSSYRLLGEAKHIDESSVALKIDEQRQLQIKFTASDELQMAMLLNEEPLNQKTVNQKPINYVRLQIRAAIAPAPATVRWQFQIELV